MGWEEMMQWLGLGLGLGLGFGLGLGLLGLGLGLDGVDGVRIFAIALGFLENV